MDKKSPLTKNRLMELFETGNDVIGTKRKAKPSKTSSDETSSDLRPSTLTKQLLKVKPAGYCDLTKPDTNRGCLSYK